MATTGQINLIRTIMSERVLEGHHIEWVEAHLAGANNSMVQTIIARLKAQPKRSEQGTLMTVERPATNPVTEEGFYQLGDDVYRVVRTRDGQRFYAKLATATGWDYESAKGIIRRLTADMAMTPEQIAAYGVAHGFCLNCSLALSDPISVHIGLGTSCGPQILGSEAYKAARKAAKLVPAVAEALAAIKAEKAAEKARGEQLAIDDNAAEAANAAAELAQDHLQGYLVRAREAGMSVGELTDGEYYADENGVVHSAEEEIAKSRRPRSQFEAIYRAMGDMGFSDSEIRDARYGQGNW